MTVIKINAITVPRDSGDELAHRFAARAGAVDDADGFEGFELLKPTDDRDQWLVITRWRDEAAFQAWLGSESFTSGHRSAGGAGRRRGAATRRQPQRGLVLRHGRRLRPRPLRGKHGRAHHPGRASAGLPTTVAGRRSTPGATPPWWGSVPPPGGCSMSPGSLFASRDFRLLLAGQTTSQLGTQVSSVALPLLAVLTLQATAFQVGLINAASTLAFALLGLPAGVWLDRIRRRPVWSPATCSGPRCCHVPSRPRSAC